MGFLHDYKVQRLQTAHIIICHEVQDEVLTSKELACLMSCKLYCLILNMFFLCIFLQKIQTSVQIKCAEKFNFKLQLYLMSPPISMLTHLPQYNLNIEEIISLEIVFSQFFCSGIANLISTLNHEEFYQIVKKF